MSERRIRGGSRLLRRWARIFDSAFRIPGTQIALRHRSDPRAGARRRRLRVPRALAVHDLARAARLRVPKVVLARMVFNALIDAIAGVVPVAGDLFDFGWKATAWNLALLEKHAMPGQRASSGDYLFVILCSAVLIVAALLPLLLIIALGAWLEQTLGFRF